MLQQAGLGPRHALQGTAKHGLDGRVGGVGEGALNRSDLDEVRLVGSHPAADAGGEVVEPLDHQCAARVFPVGLGAVEGEDEGVAEVLVSLAADVGAEPEGGGVGEMGAGEEPGQTRAQEAGRLPSCNPRPVLDDLPSGLPGKPPKRSG